MIALLADLGQMLVVFFGSDLERFAKVFDFLKKIGRTIAARCKSFERLEG
jgi:mRNA degradation ribonuclease J1/J2